MRGARDEKQGHKCFVTLVTAEVITSLMRGARERAVLALHGVWCCIGSHPRTRSSFVQGMWCVWCCIGACGAALEATHAAARSSFVQGMFVLSLAVLLLSAVWG